MQQLTARRAHLPLVLLIPILVLGFATIHALAETVAPEFTCPSCNDFNPCTIDSCDTSTGTCRHASLNCDDGDSCTTDTCYMAYPGAGGCSHQYLAPGTTCDDGNPCTANDACSSVPGLRSECIGQLQPSGTTCEDGNSCTAPDSCNVDGQCVGTPLLPGSFCDDQSLCTSQDTCVTSPGGSLVCQGIPKPCDDLDPCTQDLCDPATGQCNTPAVDCDDGNLCTDDSCDPATGSCVRTNRTMACNNGDPCTTGQICSGGNCIGGMPRDCADNISCTRDECSRNPGTYGTCLHTPDRHLCGFDGPCALWACDLMSGGCLNTAHSEGPGECDGNPCSKDACIGGNCLILSYNTNGIPCNDYNNCTTNDRCGTYGCRGTPLCDDGNQCTFDSCDQRTLVCAHTPYTSGCNDGNPCTVGDTCISGTCQGETNQLNCDDGDPCTTDSCSAAGTSCVHTDACDDGNVCTTDSCDPTSGACAHANNTDPCSDGDLCTVADMCSDGTCRGNWKCQAVNGCSSAGCTLGNCLYSSGPCADDQDPCTRDVCDTFAGCTHPPVTTRTTCGTGVCQRTVNTCVNGLPQSCLPGTPAPENCNGLDDDCDGLVDEGTDVLCDDSNSCKADACSGISGCGHFPVTDGTFCSESNACTAPSTCKSGICLLGAPLPGDPATEVCNGLDDDCDGLVDENRVRADCIVNPSTLKLDSQGGVFSVTCKLFDICDPANPVSISGATVSQVYVSRTDKADNPSDDVTRPDPFTLECPDPIKGNQYERGILENVASRDVSHANVTFKFNQPSDGDCSTLDGDRADLSASLAAIPDNTHATVCISGKTGGADFQACMLMLVQNRGLSIDVPPGVDP